MHCKFLLNFDSLVAIFKYSFKYMNFNPAVKYSIIRTFFYASANSFVKYPMWCKDNMFSQLTLFAKYIQLISNFSDVHESGDSLKVMLCTITCKYLEIYYILCYGKVQPKSLVYIVCINEQNES